MAEQTTPGGSNATDFQPTTDNPQAEVGGGLQQNSASLQPVTTNGSNVFSQPGVNPQAFPATNSLSVQNGNPQALVSSNSSDPVARSPGWSTFTLVFVVAVVLIVGLFVIVRTAKPAGKIAETPADVPAPKSTKPKAKKKPSANRRKKNTKKRNRR